ncbi:MAG: MFS transporter [Hyphomicrobiaceae bacterium]
MTTSQALSHERENQVARHNVVIYAICQALNGAASPVNIAVGGLAGSYLLGPDKSLATLPVTGFSVGMAIGTATAAFLTRLFGRKYGFIVGLNVGVIGMLLATHALLTGNFWYFCLGTTANGISAGFGQQYRFAATDRGTREFKAKAISWVLAGGVAAAIIGPQLVIFTTDLLLPVHFAGAFLSASMLFVLAMIAMMFLDTSSPQIQTTSKQPHEARPLIQILSQPRFLVALLCGTSSFALMSFVMTGAPLAMVGCGFTKETAVLGIQWHVLAMFAPSFFTGNLIARFGNERVVGVGMIILIACSVVALAGIALWNFWLSLILLGLGWNFAFIGATAMVSETYEPHERNKVQGTNDFILFSFVALASLMSGIVLNNFGWTTLNIIVFPIVALCIISLMCLSRSSRRLPL